MLVFVQHPQSPRSHSRPRATWKVAEWNLGIDLPPRLETDFTRDVYLPARYRLSRPPPRQTKSLGNTFIQTHTIKTREQRLSGKKNKIAAVARWTNSRGWFLLERSSASSPISPMKLSRLAHSA
jgi:hypothetical protein